MKAANLRERAITAYQQHAADCERVRLAQIERQRDREREARTERLRQLLRTALRVNLHDHVSDPDAGIVVVDGLCLGTIYDVNAWRLTIMQNCRDCGMLVPRAGTEFLTIEGLGWALTAIEEGRTQVAVCANCEDAHERTPGDGDPETGSPFQTISTGNGGDDGND